MPTDDCIDDPVAQQFEDRRQQKHAALLGLWIFLSTELLLFGGLFLSFVMYRWRYPVEFAEAASHLDLLLGALNTAILLTSGLLMVLAEQAVTERRRKLAFALLVAVVAAGLLFLFIKGTEWHKEYSDNLMPIWGLTFRYPGEQADIAELFFNFYYVFTGLHALHLSVGLVLVSVIAARVWRWRSPGRLQRQTIMLGMYWAFIDIVWILMFTLLYLLRT
ncbi:MAG: cytochrome c oxidase subunit 3 [Halopseudomonas sp.]|uniref:cytochrome c oxidase subunit 3 n=1 Tax=Halopseudomonas sp. TaxID=2901191 RepID=UPI003001AB83